jgi:hypothetical protein
MWTAWSTPAFFTAEHRNIAKKLGARPDKVMDNMHEVCGETGTAHSLLLLARALESAKAGRAHRDGRLRPGVQRAVLQVTDAIADLAPAPGFPAPWPARRPPTTTPSGSSSGS